MKEKEIKEVVTETKEAPEVQVESVPVKEPRRKKKEQPQTGNPENTVLIGEKLIEIKPTKLKYQRNRTAAFYKMLDYYSLTDILGFESGTLGDERDGDMALMEWLIAVTDDEGLIRQNYDEIDTGTVEKMLSIFKRVNRITEKEEKLKNLTTPGKEV